MFAVRRNAIIASNGRSLPRPWCAQRRCSLWARSLTTSSRRPAKRVSSKQVKDLVQGPLKADLEPLHPSDKTDLRQESLQDVVKNNMRKFPDCVLLTRVGNFYELYYEHADIYAPMLDLRVAAKGKEGISMAGFQWQFLGKYLKRLVQEYDKHVAICNEFPEYDKNGKLHTPIPRRVTRVVTPGTLIDEDFLDQGRNNFLLSVHQKEQDIEHIPEQKASKSFNDERFGLAWIDISTGEFFVQTTTRTSLPSALMRIGPSEVVVSQNISTRLREEIALSLSFSVERLTTTARTDVSDNPNEWLQRLDQPIDRNDQLLLAEEETVACRNLFDYIDNHLLEARPKVRPPQRREQADTMAIDRSSIRGLELLKTARDGLGKGSLINTISRTVTKGGSRLLRERLLYPSITTVEIEHRLDLVSAFMSLPDLHRTIVAYLRQLYDVVRIAQKLTMNRGDADEMQCLANTYLKMVDIMRMLQSHRTPDTSQGKALQILVSRFVSEGPSLMAERIKESIDEGSVTDWLTLEEENEADELDDDAESPALARTPGSTNGSRNGLRRGANDFPLIMQRTASPQMERLHDRLSEVHGKQLALQESLRDRLAAPKLALKYDPKYGHICQTPRTKGMTDETIQNIGGTLVGHLKTIKTFYFQDWTALGRQLETIKFEIRQEEQKIFETLRQLVVENLVPLRQNAAVMNELDLATSFATLALEEGWSRPVISNQNIHNIIGGRHPTVKLGLQEKGQSFVSNDLHLDRKARAWLITGPNMAGKSTFLRQNALITILAQMGSYVPAEYAEIGIVDKMFSRIGAADDLFRNESTFMVEMLETAGILKEATERSFVIMDEVGRGTAPLDGAAVAYASLHHLYYSNKCRTLFATHFHELADRTHDWQHLAQYCSDFNEDDTGSFSFVHKLRPGVNKRSHALKVAEMAGLPQAALTVAQGVLDEPIE